MANDGNQKSFIKRIPNILTMIRLFLVPVFIFFFTHPGIVLPGRYFAMIIFVVAMLTDLLDGYIARKYNAITDFGKLVDPLADKLMTVSALICFYLSGTVKFFFVALVFAKELVMILGSYVMLRNKIVVYSEIFGKIAAATMALAITLTFLPGISPWNEYVLYLAIGLTLCALFRYTRSAIKQLEEKKQKTDNKS